MQIAAANSMVPAPVTTARDESLRALPARTDREPGPRHAPAPIVLEGELLGGSPGQRDSETERDLREAWLLGQRSRSDRSTPAGRAAAAYLDTAAASDPAALRRRTGLVDVYA